MRLFITYRWELTLFFLLPLFLMAVNRLLWSPTFLNSPWALINLEAIILGAAYYFWVRREGRPILSLVWLFLLVMSLVSTVQYAFFVAFPDTFDAIFHAGATSTLHYWTFGDYVLTLSVITAFAWVASRISYRHGLVFIALSAGLEMTHSLPGIYHHPVVGWLRDDLGANAWLLGNVGFKVGTSAFMFWVLSRVDIPRRAMSTKESRLRRLLRKLDPAYGVSVPCLVVLLFLVLNVWSRVSFFDIINSEYVTEIIDVSSYLYLLIEPPTRLSVLAVALLTFVLHKTVNINLRFGFDLQGANTAEE